MLRKLLLGVAVAALAVTAAAQNLTLDQILAKNLQARGGMEKLKAAKTMRITAKMTVGPGIEAPVVIEQKRPNSMRFEITIQGLTAIQAYDGKTGWSIMPFQGKKDPEPMGEDALKEMAEQADFDGPLVDYQQKGHKVELVGREPVEGADAYKLKVTLKDGGVRYIYLDADSFLEMKSESKRTICGTEVEGEASIGDYKEVEGLMIPHSVEGGVKGSPQKQKMTIEKVEINPPIDDARFKMPEVKKEEPKTEEKKPGF
jgi:outer membrane lipoprotein-sorting protein